MVKYCLKRCDFNQKKKYTTEHGKELEIQESSMRLQSGTVTAFAEALSETCWTYELRLE